VRTVEDRILLSYCLNCKKDTATVIRRDPGPFGLLGAKIRYCRECARVKPKTELEMEK
jgi:hypothetical protein